MEYITVNSGDSLEVTINAEDDSSIHSILVELDINGDGSFVSTGLENKERQYILVPDSSSDFEVGFSFPNLSRGSDAGFRKLKVIVKDIFNNYSTEEYNIDITSSVDQDTDGIADDIENLAGDRNNDGTPDSQQTNVASFPKLNSSSNNPDDFITLASAGGTSLVGVSLADNPAPNAENTPTEVDFPIGFLNFDIEEITAGGTTQVTLLLPEGISADTYWKYDANQGWYEFLYDGTTGAEFESSDGDNINDQVILHFVDGERGDSDGMADGRISDPGAPGMTQNPVIDPNIFDIGGNGEPADQSDGFLFLAHTLGGGLIPAMINDPSLGANISRTAEEISQFIDDRGDIFDIGGNGEPADQSDGFLFLAHTLGGGLIPAMINDPSLGANISRTAEEISQFIDDGGDEII